MSCSEGHWTGSRIRRASIVHLALRNQGFRSLCEEYDLARKSYGLLQVSPERAKEVAEYRTLLTDLEQEIRSFLQSDGTAK